jgi:hypothetical protein
MLDHVVVTTVRRLESSRDYSDKFIAEVNISLVEALRGPLFVQRL